MKMYLKKKSMKKKIISSPESSINGNEGIGLHLDENSNELSDNSENNIYAILGVRNKLISNQSKRETQFGYDIGKSKMMYEVQ